MQELLMSDYGPKLDGTLPSLAPFIASANSITSTLYTRALAKEIIIASDNLELIERWLAAHCYVMSDQPYAERKTGQSSAVFQGRTGMYLEASKYGQMAIVLDPSGLLRTLGQGKRATADWVGTPLSEQVPYVDRD